MMKKILLFLALAVLSVSKGQAQIYMQQTNLNTSVLGAGDLYFVQKSGSADTWAVGQSKDAIYTPNFDINNITRLYIPQTAEEKELAVYKSPSYADDYRSMNAWSNRSQWQLANVHDPSVMRASDGYFYMYQTDASYGNVHQASGAHFYCRRSKDLVNWEPVGMCMPGVPAWLKDTLNNIRRNMGLSASTIDFTKEKDFGYWAPCVRKVSDSLYRMYYVITCPGTLASSTSTPERCFIGLMESSNPADSSSWKDKGMVITQYSDKNLNYISSNPYGAYYKYNAIDPAYIITPSGEHWLVYGSWHSGFPAVRIDPSTGKTLNALGNPWGAASEPSYGKRVFTRYANDRWQASEAPEVVYHDGYYYLFVAFDELAVNYNTRVLRSRNIDGPYVDITGKDFTDGTSSGNVYPVVTHPYKFGRDHGWVGISHCAVFDDGNGRWFYASQQRFPELYNGDAYSNAIMVGGIRRIIWTESGWPVVLPERYGNVPQTTISEDELSGIWENINLVYDKGKQDSSVIFTLKNDHTVAGAAFTGSTWSFDASANILKVGDVKLYLAREVDWEASPRHATVVYAGYNGAGTVTYWGKRVSAPQVEPVTPVVLEVVGAADNSSPFWTSFSNNLVSASSSCIFHFTFTNYTDESANWNNWLLAVTNGRDRSASDYKEFVVLRADAYGWNSLYNTANNSNWYTSLTHNYDWNTFKNDLNGAVVDLTVSVSATTMTITAVTTTVTEKKYTETFVMPVEPGLKGAFLSCEKSHLSITDEEVINK